MPACVAREGMEAVLHCRSSFVSLLCCYISVQDYPQRHVLFLPCSSHSSSLIDLVPLFAVFLYGRRSIFALPCSTRCSNTTEARRLRHALHACSLHGLVSINRALLSTCYTQRRGTRKKMRHERSQPPRMRKEMDNAGKKTKYGQTTATRAKKRVRR